MFTVMEGLVETALDTPRFGIVVSLSVDSRSSTANSSTVPRFIEGFRERDKFLRIISAGLCFSDTFYQDGERLDTFQEAGYFHLSELYETRSHFVLGHQANEIPRFS